jgi:MFS family permease
MRRFLKSLFSGSTSTEKSQIDPINYRRAELAKLDDHDLTQHSELVPSSANGLNRNRDFLKLWAGETVSDLGTYIGVVSIGFAAVITLGASPLQMGMLVVVSNLPALLFSLLTGVWVDRVRRRPLMIASDLGRFVLLATIPIAAAVGTLRMAQLYVVIFASSMLDLIFGVSYRSYLPSIVPGEQLVAANSRLTASSSVAMISGWGLAGWIVQWLTAPFAIGIDAVSFLASALAIGLVRKPEPAPELRAAEDTILSEIAEGGRFLFAERRLRAFGVAALVLGLSQGLLSTAFMLFLVNALGFKTGVLGVMFAAGGASALFASIVARRLGDRFGPGRAMVAGLALNSGGLGLIALAHGANGASTALVLAQQILSGFGVIIFGIHATSVIQAITPSAMLGRATASYRFVVTATLMIGALVAGLATGTAWLRHTIAVSAAISCLAAVLLAMSPVAQLQRAHET